MIYTWGGSRRTCLSRLFSAWDLDSLFGIVKTFRPVVVEWLELHGGRRGVWGARKRWWWQDKGHAALEVLLRFMKVRVPDIRQREGRGTGQGRPGSAESAFTESEVAPKPPGSRPTTCILLALSGWNGRRSLGKLGVLPCPRTFQREPVREKRQPQWDHRRLTKYKPGGETVNQTNGALQYRGTSTVILRSFSQRKKCKYFSFTSGRRSLVIDVNPKNHRQW